MSRTTRTANLGILGVLMVAAVALVSVACYAAIVEKAPATAPAATAPATGAAAAGIPADYAGKPFGGKAREIPGTIQAEDYDVASAEILGVPMNAMADANALKIGQELLIPNPKRFSTTLRRVFTSRRKSAFSVARSANSRSSSTSNGLVM